MTVLYFFGVDNAMGQGRLLSPPGRSSLWRLGYGTPVNNNDNALSCGGIQRRWTVNMGKCGVCGDPWDMKPRDNEAGGQYAREIISGVYTSGDIIEAMVDVANANGGYFEFHICANNNFTSPVKEECLEKGLLTLVDGETTKYEKIKNGYNKVLLKLPEGLTCDQCVLRWKYRTADQYGCETNNLGKQVCGFGRGEMQTEYYACADIAIYSDAKKVEEFYNMYGALILGEEMTYNHTNNASGRTKRTAHLGVNPSRMHYNPTVPAGVEIMFHSANNKRGGLSEQWIWDFQGRNNPNERNTVAGRIRRRTHLPQVPNGISLGNPHLNGLVSPVPGSRGSVRSSFNLRRNGVSVHGETQHVDDMTHMAPQGIPVSNIPFSPLGDIFSSHSGSMQSVIIPPEPSLIQSQQPTVRAIIRPVAKISVDTLSISQPTASLTVSSGIPAVHTASLNLDARMHRNFIDPLSPLLQPDIASNTQKILSRSNYKPTKKCLHCPFDQCLDDKLRIDHLFPGLFDSPTQFFECKRFERVFTLGNYDIVQEGLPSCGHPRFKRQLMAQFDDDDIGCCATRPQVILPLTVEAENDTFSVVQLGDAKKQFIVQGICGKSNTTTCTVCAAENNFQWVLVYDPRVNTNPPVSFVPVKFPHYCRCYNYMSLKG